MVQSDKLKKIIAEVKEESSPVITLSNELIADFSKELDSAISELDMIMESIGENSIEDIPDSQIEYYCVKIPALMYYAGQRVEELGMQVDLASNAKKSAQNEAMVKVSGTVQEKKARVEQLTEDKALVEAIYRRAYNSLKVKLEMAEKIYSGLKKSLSKRIAEVDLDRFSKDKYTREPEDPMEDFRRQAIEDRCKQEAQWLIDNPKDSIRKVAREFCISKSQLHRDLHELRNIDDDLYVQCRNILRRHRRSGGKVR